jgi:hypothetical protein
MLIVDIANSIILENQVGCSQGIASVAYWCRHQIGYLNTLLYEDFSISQTTQEITKDNPDWYTCCNLLDGGNPTVNTEAVAILKQLFKIYNLQLQVQNNMNSIQQNDLIAVNDNFGGTQFTRINRNEVCKTLISMRKDEIAILNDMVGRYNIRRGVVRAIHGDDTETPPFSPFPNYIRGV